MGDAMQVYDTLETLCKCMTRCNTCTCACTCCALFFLLQEKQQKKHMSRNYCFPEEG